MAPPTPSTTAETVATRPEVTRKAVHLDRPGDTGRGVQVRITRVRAIRARAQLPGEVAGPAVAVTVTVRNGSTAPVDLSSVVVTLTDSAQAPGPEMSTKPAHPFSGTCGVGRSATAVYVFRVPPERRTPVRITVSLGGAAPALLFAGDVA